MIMNETDFGLMLYFGASKIKDSKLIFSEPSYEKDVLMHIIIGLKTVQHKGNMVIKVKFYDIL